MKNFTSALIVGLVATLLSASAFAAQKSITPLSAPPTKIAANKAVSAKVAAQTHLVSKKHMFNKKLNDKKA